MVSVCMATYNGEKFLREQLDSILVQLAPEDEIIISDDNSSDNTCSIIETYNDKRIRLLHNDMHSCKWNFAYALQHAHGDYIFFADQDDVWLAGKYDACLRELQQYDLVVTDSIVTDEHLIPLQASFFQYHHSRKGLLRNILKSCYYGSCMAFRRSVLDAALPFPQTKEIGHDIWIGLVAEMIGKVKFLPTPYIYYRRHETTETNPMGNLLTRSHRPLGAKVWSRMVVIKEVMNFYIRTRCKRI